MWTIEKLFERWNVGDGLGHSCATDAVYGYGSDPEELMPFCFFRTGDNEITAKRFDDDGELIDKRIIWNGKPVWEALEDETGKQDAIRRSKDALLRIEMWKHAKPDQFSEPEKKEWRNRAGKLDDLWLNQIDRNRKYDRDCYIFVDKSTVLLDMLFGGPRARFDFHFHSRFSRSDRCVIYLYDWEGEEFLGYLVASVVLEKRNWRVDVKEAFSYDGTAKRKLIRGFDDPNDKLPQWQRDALFVQVQNIRLNRSNQANVEIFDFLKKQTAKKVERRT